MIYNLKLVRQLNNKITAIGEWYWQNKKLGLQSLEDTDRGLKQSMPLNIILEKKVKEVTAIPIGTYNLSISKSPKYGEYMIHVDDVKGYSGILIHPLNSAKDTEGCLGIGESVSKDTIGNSRLSYRKLLNTLAFAMNFQTINKEKNWTEIIYDPNKPSLNQVKLTIETNY